MEENIIIPIGFSNYYCFGKCPSNGVERAENDCCHCEEQDNCKNATVSNNEYIPRQINAKDINICSKCNVCQEKNNCINLAFNYKEENK